MRTNIFPPRGTKGIRVEAETPSTALYVDTEYGSVRAELPDTELEWLIDQLQRARAARRVLTS
jgi:hypothetical protein